MTIVNHVDGKIIIDEYNYWGNVFNSSGFYNEKYYSLIEENPNLIVGNIPITVLRTICKEPLIEKEFFDKESIDAFIHENKDKVLLLYAFRDIYINRTKCFGTSIRYNIIDDKVTSTELLCYLRKLTITDILNSI